MDNKQQQNDQKETDKLKRTSTKQTFLEKIKSNSFYKYLQRESVKKYMFVTLSAIVVGLMFGFVTLNILNHVGQPIDVDAVMTDGQATEQNDQGLLQDIEQLNAYVLQGGVFSSEENLHKWQDHFQEKGYPSVVWERDHLYYLFLGLAPSEQALNNLQHKMTDDGLDVYVKEWQTVNKEINLSEEDLLWVKSFITLWKSSITSVDEDNELSQKWHELVESNEELSEEIVQFNNNIADLLNDRSFTTEQERQYVLLTLWMVFERDVLS